jgi:riboflavin kinase/FMN adenylyltransferase
VVGRTGISSQQKERSMSSIPVYRALEELPADFGPSVVAIGNFDGVHLGHREILSAVVAEARVTGSKAVAVTFDPHPEHFFRLPTAPAILTPLPERMRLLACCGLDAVLVLPFNAQLASLSAHEFARRILADALHTSGVHEGGNFRFGEHARAGVAELSAMGMGMGFSVQVHQPVRVRGLEVSSSAIRQHLLAGDLSRARWMLGRSFSVLSSQARGRGIGSRLLVPTVNLAEYEGLLPVFGVYVTRMTIGDRSFQAVTNVGNRPTFGAPSFAVESYILDFEPIEMTPETPIEQTFLFRLRGEMTWPSPEALKTQIMKDVSRARRYFQKLDRK